MHAAGIRGRCHQAAAGSAVRPDGDHPQADMETLGQYLTEHGRQRAVLHHAAVGYSGERGVLGGGSTPLTVFTACEKSVPGATPAWCVAVADST